MDFSLGASSTAAALASPHLDSGDDEHVDHDSDDGGDGDEDCAQLTVEKGDSDLDVLRAGQVLKSGTAICELQVESANQLADRIVHVSERWRV